MENILVLFTILNIIIENLIEKKTDLKKRLELISKYSNNTLVRNLSVPEKLLQKKFMNQKMSKNKYFLNYLKSFKITLLSINVKIVEDYLYLQRLIIIHIKKQEMTKNIVIIYIQILVKLAGKLVLQISIRKRLKIVIF